MQTIAEKWIERGMQKGMQQGKIEKALEAAVLLILRDRPFMLPDRFDKLIELRLNS
jgi:hypothetical protein